LRNKDSLICLCQSRRPIIKSALLSSCLFVFVTVFLRTVPVVFHYPQSATNFDHGANYFFPFDLLVAAAFANMLVSFKHSANLKSPPGALVNRQLSGFSFSLYCIHFPVLYFVASISMRLFGVGFHYAGNDYVGALLVSIGVVTAIAAAFAFSRITEIHTDTVRARITSLIERRATTVKSLAEGGWKETRK